MEKTRLNERFTNVADRVSSAIGEWWVTALSVLALLLWLALGPSMHFSDTWQLIANTPTTWIELFLGFLIAAAANRVERANRHQMDRLEALEAQIDEVVEGMARLLQVDHEEHGRLLHSLYGINEEQLRILHDIGKIEEEIDQEG